MQNKIALGDSDLDFENMLQINYFHDISRLKEGKILLRDLKKKKKKTKANCTLGRM